MAERSGSLGRLTYGPAPDDALVPRTMEFVANQLPRWRDDPKRPRDTGEKLLNSSLCTFLERQARQSEFVMVQFQHEKPQSGTRTVDLAVHAIESEVCVGAFSYSCFEPFMVIEAKRLPAPSRDREREYVTGMHGSSGSPSGGIQRFKLGLHGGSVETAAIVGYVQSGTLCEWHATINQWIAEMADKPSSDGCVWEESDLLGELCCNDDRDTSRSESTHRRSATCRTRAVKICHLWVKMKSEQP